MRRNAEFDRCIDFLVRMIEKYGDEVLQQIAADTLYDCQDDATEKSPTNREENSGTGFLSA